MYVIHDEAHSYFYDYDLQQTADTVSHQDFLATQIIWDQSPCRGQNAAQHNKALF